MSVFFFAICNQTSSASAWCSDNHASHASADASSTLEECGLSLSDTDAESREPIAAAAPAELVQERDDEAGAAHPEGVAERDRAPVHVHALLVEPQLTDDDEALRRERLVQLDEVEI